ncbi:MAG: type ISP restriction/modification enzyme [Bacteroidales bacterium]|jgi:very-short-patch-repair endonuclease|nr:DUF559 domain-containing protein [Bacteroidales bacterium]
MTIPEYIEKINTRYKAGISTEHSYRGDLQNLLETITPDVLVTNEPTRVACGAPDYIITKRKIPVGYIEAKDLGADLNSKQYKEQFDRYRSSLPNLIITNYLQFSLYIEGNYTTSVTLADIQGNKIVAKTENIETFTRLIQNFCSYAGQTIKSPSKLAGMMAAKARLLANTIDKALSAEEPNTENMVYENANNSIRQQLTAFQQHLIHDITVKEFSDIYAQTIAYGMFAARYHDSSLKDFTRQEAAELIPKTNPFLRKLFQYIAGYDLDERIKWIVDELVTIFQASDVAAILNNFGKATQQTDPIIHFYETFLSEYDPKLRKARGVWYTPEPVVNFIVRAVDDILKTEFGLENGLADTTKTKIKVKEPVKATADRRSNVTYVDVEKEVHKVQILDPACGTGTFLAEIVKQIYKRFEGQQGIWSQYVEDHLIPRLNGFELLMASYSMAHLKMDMLFHETGYRPSNGGIGGGRFRIYLTNSLEEHHPDTGTLFASWLSDEASEANRVKRDTPVMVIIGNPPYSVSSSNKGEWIQNLISDYKKDLNERKINLDDDYIKFIRYGQHFIEKNGEGILAYISNNSFIDGVTHRQMRKHLLESFDKIYILDLHGNAKKKEVCQDGSYDQNVFDIMQGVSINIFVKTGKKNKNGLGQILHSDLQGKREFKYETLNLNSYKSIKWNVIKYQTPNYFFVPRNVDAEDRYSLGFSINILFVNSNSGIQTKNDGLTINMNKNELEKVVNNFKEITVENLKRNYSLTDTSGWTAQKAKDDIINNKGAYYKIFYRPFDIRFIYMTEKSGGFVGRPRLDTMRHFFNGDNLGLITVRQQSTFDFQHILVSKTLMESGAISLQTKEWGYIYPLYLYPETTAQQSTEQTPERIPNLNLVIVNQIAEKLGLTFTPEKPDFSPSGNVSEGHKGQFAPIDILDYIYAVLHSPTYREKYKEFLKIDFPRVPYPENKETFWQLVALGGELRQLHLLESPKVNQFITTYPETGTNEVTKVRFELLPTPAYAQEEDDFDDNKVMEYGWQTAAPGYYAVRKEDKDRLKANMTEAEKILWQELRGKKLGARFRRQHIVDCFIPDFVCLWYKLIIEVDGKIHDFQKEYDESRTARLNEIGYEVLRFKNEEVLNNIAVVLEKIKTALKQREHIAIAAQESSGHPASTLLRRAGVVGTTKPEGEHGVVGKVWINETQYFAGVPQIAWEFYIGGYQPAQKWLKDRKGRGLSFEDILHYQKIIVSLTETARVMGEIDKTITF